MIELRLRVDQFENGHFEYRYGDKIAVFEIINEDFSARSEIGIINKILITVYNQDDSGTVLKAKNVQLQSSVIGLGNNVVGVRSDNAALRGKILSKDNIDQCVILLYE